MEGTLDQLHRFDGGQGNRDFGLVVACGPEIYLVGGDVRVDTHRNSYYLGPGCRRDADELFVTAGKPEQGDDLFVGHLDSAAAGNHNLGSVGVPRHVDVQQSSWGE
jgi:hypothetical protein